MIETYSIPLSLVIFRQKKKAKIHVWDLGLPIFRWFMDMIYIYKALYKQSEVYVTIKIIIAIIFCDFEEGGILCQ